MIAVRRSARRIQHPGREYQPSAERRTDEQTPTADQPGLKHLERARPIKRRETVIFLAFNRAAEPERAPQRFAFAL